MGGGTDGQSEKSVRKAGESRVQRRGLFRETINSPCFCWLLTERRSLLVAARGVFI